MTALLLRLVLFVVVGVAIFWGARKIWREWTGAFRAEDKARLDRDRAERDRMRRADGGMITLKRDKDGKFRPEE
jgi:hypothetical protein